MQKLCEQELRLRGFADTAHPEAIAIAVGYAIKDAFDVIPPMDVQAAFEAILLSSSSGEMAMRAYEFAEVWNASRIGK